ncbi:MAG: NmrA family NAD(P)-binding protein [Acidobacteriota bacterium]
MKSVLVLGSTGSVGRALSESLVARGVAVRGATRDASSHPVEGVQPVRLELQDESTLKDALGEVEGLFVMSPPGHRDAHTLLGPLLERAFALPSLKRVVTLSAQGAEADDAIPLRQTELKVEASGVPWVHLRPSWFMQNFHTFWGDGVRQHNLFRLPADQAKVGFIDTRDIAASACAALTEAADRVTGRAWTLTGPAALDHAEAAAVLSEVLGRTITYEAISDEAFRRDLTPSGLPEDYIGLLVELFAAVRAGGASQINDHVQQLTGQPPRSLATYARDYADALK